MVLRKLRNYAAWCHRLEEKIDRIRIQLLELIYNLLTKVLKIKNPSYIDIGAHHPYEISNTAIFYEHGCRGVNIEANPILFNSFLKERPEDINLSCGLGAKAGELPFYMVTDDGGRNSFNKKQIEDWLAVEHPGMEIQKQLMINVRTLQDVFEHELAFTMPDYMTIDIEGLEYDVLSSFDMKKYGPKVITVELNDKEIIPYMEQSGYFLYVKILSNYTYIRNEYKAVVDK